MQVHCFHDWVLLILVVFMTLFAQIGALAGQRYFTIQVSSCKQHQSAVTEVDRFKKQGYDAFYRHEIIKNKGNWYRVYVGRHGSREEALKEAKTLKKQGRISYYAIRAITDLVPEEMPRKEAFEKKPEQASTKSESSSDIPPPATGTPAMGEGSKKETPSEGAFQRALAGPGAGGATFKFKVPEKKEVPGETVPAVREKDGFKGPFRRKGAVVSKDAIREMLSKHHFYSTCSNHNFDFCNPDGDFSNQFEDNGDGTATDRATHLMWEKGGVSERRTFLDALKYGQDLNNRRFGGYSDWRVPTIEELASLLESSWKNEDLFIDPVFDTQQRSCWSTDTQGLERAWKVDFYLGYVADDPMTFLHWVRAVRSVQ